MYQALILPIISYGAGAWYKAVEHIHVKRQIYSAQRFALLSLSRACRTVSTVALQVLTGSLPIDIMITIRGIQSKIRTDNRVKWKEYETPENIENLTKKDINKKKRKIRQIAMKVWQTRWQDDNKGRITYEFIPNVTYAINNKKWFHPGLYTTFLLTGHGTINSKLQQLGRSDSDKCCFCIGKTEDVQHIILDCIEYNKFRKDKIENDILKIIEKKETMKILIENKGSYLKFSEIANEIFNHKKTYLDSRVDPPPRG